jgi:hypothetical protein
MFYVYVIQKFPINMYPFLDGYGAAIYFNSHKRSPVNRA